MPGDVGVEIMNVDQMMEHAFAHGISTVVRRNSRGYQATAADALGSSTKTAKHGRDALEYVLCVRSFEWEDLDKAAAFRVAIPRTA